MRAHCGGRQSTAAGRTKTTQIGLCRTRASAASCSGIDYCPGMDPLDDLPPDSRREVTAAVATVLGVATQDAEQIVRASLPLWDALEDAGGLVDSWGGGEYCALFPQMCAILRPPAG